MRAIPALALLVACSDSPSGPMKFDDSGGTLDVSGCGYSVTTKFGAEKPYKSGSTTGADPTPQFVHLDTVLIFEFPQQTPAYPCRSLCFDQNSLRA